MVLGSHRPQLGKFGPIHRALVCPREFFDNLRCSQRLLGSQIRHHMVSLSESVWFHRIDVDISCVFLELWLRQPIFSSLIEKIGCRLRVVLTQVFPGAFMRWGPRGQGTDWVRAYGRTCWKPFSIGCRYIFSLSISIFPSGGGGTIKKILIHWCYTSKKGKNDFLF